MPSDVPAQNRTILPLHAPGGDRAFAVARAHHKKVPMTGDAKLSAAKAEGGEG